MNIGDALKTLQDPMGLPFFPILFQILMVLTFALHILFVNFALGSMSLSVYGYLNGEERWRRLSKSLVKATTVNISLAMLLGIAPLLFIQVVYDPFWYVSNTLSAAWVIGFIVFMILAYDLTYIFYLKRKDNGKGLAVFGIAGLALLLLVGIIMHALVYQAHLPQKWYSWYFSGNSMDTSGLTLHAFMLSRFLHFIIPSFAMAGVFLMLYSWYFKERDDFDKEYLEWVGKTGANLAFIFTAIQVLVGFWWLLSVPVEFKFFTNPLLLLGALLGIVLLILLNTAKKDPVKYAVPSLVLAFLTIFVMSYAREALRMNYVGQVGYSIFDYKLNIDLGSTVLFLVTFVMGLFVGGYLWMTAFKSGRAKGEYTATEGMHKWGRVSIFLLLCWLVIVAGLGVVIFVKNYIL